MTDPLYVGLSDCTDIRPCAATDCPRDATKNVTVPPLTPALAPFGPITIPVCDDHLPPGETL